MAKGSTSRKRIRREALKARRDNILPKTPTDCFNNLTTSKPADSSQLSDIKSPIVPSTSPTGPCQNFCCSPFSTIQAEPILSLPRLRNRTHLMFNRWSFPRHIDYNALEPCLQLATQLLTSTPLVPYLNTLFDGEIYDSDRDRTFDWAAAIPKHYKGLLSVWPKSGQDEVTDVTRERAKTILHDMGGMIQFDVRPLAPGTLGLCQPTPESLSPDLAARYPCGRRSKITLNQAVYDDFILVTNLYRSWPRDKPCDWTMLVHQQFRIAQVLCHEIGHALQSAAFDPESRGTLPEVLFKDSQIAEAGFEMEYQLFGGLVYDYSTYSAVVNWQTYHQDGCLVGRQRWPRHSFHFLEWPSAMISTIYMQSSGIETWSGEMFPPHEMMWSTPNSFILSLLDDKFWEEAQKNDDVNCLHPPKVVSWPFRYDAERSRLRPLQFTEVEEFVGLRRAHRLCSTILLPLWRRPEALVQDWANVHTSITLAWFDESLIAG